MIRIVERIETAVVVQEGNGLPVRRALPLERLPNVNPFLLLEELGPINLAAGDVRTAPPHPACGLEQITWMLAGSVTHHRPSGPTAIAANQAEWVATGTGDLHREEFSPGDVRSLRIWFSLPRLERNMPRLSVTTNAASESIQMWTTAGTYAGRLQIDLVTGYLLGARAPILTKARVTIARLRLPADTTFVHAVDSREPGLQSPTVMLYCLNGQAQIGSDDRLLRAQELAILTPPRLVASPPQPNSDEIRIRTRPGETFDILWLSGFPVGTRALAPSVRGEPIVQHGSIVMRTEDEVLQAIEEFRTGRFGTLAP